MTDPYDLKGHFDRKPSVWDGLREYPYAIRFYYRSSPRDAVVVALTSILTAPNAALIVVSTKKLTDAVTQGRYDEAWLWVGGLTLASVFTLLFRYLRNLADQRLLWRSEYLVKRAMLETVSGLPYHVLLDPNFRMLATAFENESDSMRNAVSRLTEISAFSFTFLGYLSSFLYLPWWIFLVLLATGAYRTQAVLRSTERQWNLLQNKTREGRRALYVASKLVIPREALIAKMNGMAAPFIKAWDGIVGGILEKKDEDYTRLELTESISSVLETAAKALALVAVTLDIAAGRLPVSSLVVFIAAYGQLDTLISQLSFQMKYISQEITFLPTFRRFLSLPAESDEGAPVPVQPLEVEFHDVWFRYPDASTDVLRGVNLRLVEGEHVGLVGLNGAGKTTLLNLLFRAYAPTRGTITVNGVDLQSLQPSAWRRALSVMTQEAEWFDDTLRERVRYGDMNREEDADRLALALETSGLGDIVKDLPKGLDTHVGRDHSMPEDEAIEFSGGQKQISTIARTLYRRARLYIFDEPTSAVDAEKEEHFFRNLLEATQDQMVIFVSHRFSTLRRVKRIVVMDNGVVIEDGSHEDLLAKQGRYAELFSLQAKMYQ
jgi:ATP-binding cassette subfamily B protein